HQRLVAAGDEDLLAAEHPVLAAAHGGGADGGGVGAAVRLGHGHGRPLGPALAVAGQEALLLLRGARGLDGGPAQAGPGTAEVDAGVAPGERLYDVHDRLRSQAVALAAAPGAEGLARAQA